MGEGGSSQNRGVSYGVCFFLCVIRWLVINFIKHQEG